MLMQRLTDTLLCCDGESPDLAWCTVQKMKGQVTGLKASRDKLLAEVDRQSRKIDRLLSHNETLEQVNLSLLCCVHLWVTMIGPL